MRTRRRLTSALGVTALAAALLLTGCGDDSGSDGSGSDGSGGTESESATPQDAGTEASPSAPSSEASSSGSPSSGSPSSGAPSDGSSSDGSTDDVAAIAEPEPALRSWIEATTEGDASAACELQTENYTELLIQVLSQQGTVEDDASCSEAVAAMSQTTDNAQPLKIAEMTRMEVSDDEVKFQVSFEDSDVVERYYVVKEDGGWLVDRPG